MPKLEAEGTFEARVVDIYPARVGANETLCLKLGLAVVGSDHDGKHVYGDIWFSDKSRQKSIETLEALGCAPAEYETLKGEIVEIVVEQDGDYFNVKWFNPVGGNRHSETSKDDFLASVLGTKPAQKDEGDDELDV